MYKRHESMKREGMGLLERHSVTTRFSWDSRTEIRVRID